MRSQEENKIFKQVNHIVNYFYHTELIYGDDIVYLFVLIFENRLIYTGENGNYWFHFHQDNHRWVQENIENLCALTLRVEFIKFSCTMHHISYNDHLQQLIPSETDLTVAQKLIPKIIDVILTPEFFNGVLLSIRKTFYNSQFFLYKDMKPVIVCKNGVIDLNNLEFRNGDIEDLCCMTTYVSYHTPSEKELEDLEVFLLNFFHNKFDIQCFLNQICYGIFGGLPGKRNYINGDQSLEPVILRHKSPLGMGIIRKFVSTMLGQYKADFSVSSSPDSVEKGNNRIYCQDTLIQSVPNYPPIQSFQNYPLIQSFQNYLPNQNLQNKIYSSYLRQYEIKQVLNYKKVSWVRYYGNIISDMKIGQYSYESKVKCFLEINNNEYSISKKNLNLSDRRKLESLPTIEILMKSECITNQSDLRKDLKLDFNTNKNTSKVDYVSSDIISEIDRLAPICLWRIINMRRNMI